MIYIASPYSHPDPLVMQERYEKVRDYVAHCLNNGMYVYSPINDNHPVALHHSLPTTWEFWSGLDKHFMDRCDYMIVYKLPGWETSIGVAAELAYAKEIGLNVQYIDPIKI
jgi:hypothetical protein